MSTKYASIIKNLRMKGGFSQLSMADKLGLSRQSYMAVERGVRELTLDEAERICGIFGIAIEALEHGETPDDEKYKHMILAFLRQGGKLPKTKLAKLLYFADFGWFYYHLKSMSGMQYRKMNYGPVSDAYFRIIDDMFDHGEVDITTTQDGAMIISQTRSGAKISMSKINKEEESLIEKIEKKWRDKKTAEIVDFTHKQFPYLYAQQNEIVSYGLFTQENPDEIF